MKLLLILFALSPVLVFSQQKYTLSGKISDSKTGEDLIGATILTVENGKGCLTNTYGFYSLSLPEGKFTLRFSYLGYEKNEQVLILDKNKTLNIGLSPSLLALGEVIVSSGHDDRNINGEPGVEKLIPKAIESIPVLFGEKDILKTIQLLPGISSSTEGNTGFNVRGGSAGQNLILLDEAPVYSSSHLMGFFSVFNSDALKDVTIYKGGVPAKYGGRASSVLDITMNNGNTRSFSSSGGIGLISSRLTLEFPIIKDNLSLVVSGRRTYGDLIARVLFPENLVSNDMKFYFYDLNAKLNYSINPRNRLLISGYFGEDIFELGGNIGTGWGNTTGTIRLNHVFNSSLFSNTSFIYSNYNYGFIYGQDRLKLKSGIRDFSLKEDFTKYFNTDNTVQFGFNIICHTFRPGELTTSDSLDFEVVLGEKQGIESAIYIQNEQKISARLSADYGLRFSSFFQTGPAWFYNYNTKNAVVDSVFYGSGKAAYAHFIPEPRISVNYLTGANSSLKLSYTRMAQYIHLLSNTTSGSPTDVWLPGSNNLKPLIADQVSAGFFRNFLENGIEASAEIYYKKMKNTSDYEDGADIIFNKHVESQIQMGRGRSYGLELYLKKMYGKLSGWVSYTISRTENKTPGINSNEWYPFRYDKTNDISVVSIFKAGRRITLSGVWVYSTGSAVTFPTGKYLINNIPVPYYTERNGYRMPDYHRLDLSITIDGKNRKRFKSQWNFSVYNVYNRYNAYMINFRESQTIPGETEAVRLSLFGIVPSVGYNFKF